MKGVLLYCRKGRRATEVAKVRYYSQDNSKVGRQVENDQQAQTVGGQGEGVGAGYLQCPDKQNRQGKREEALCGCGRDRLWQKETLSMLRSACGSGVGRWRVLPEASKVEHSSGISDNS